MVAFSLALVPDVRAMIGAGDPIKPGRGWAYPDPNVIIDEDTCPADNTPGGDMGWETFSNDGSGCGSCGAVATRAGYGMPAWWVSEPLTSLWWRDTPLFYQPSRGRALRFQLLYNDRDYAAELQGELDATSLALFAVGTHVFTPWKSYLKSLDGTNSFALLNGLGGYVRITNTACGGSPDYRSRLICTVGANGLPSITYPSGASDVYGLKLTGPPDRYLLTERRDASGNTTRFGYDTNVAASGITCLTNISDCDGRAMTFVYTNVNGYYQIAEVHDPVGHVAYLQYDGSYPPRLVQVTDALNLSSSMAYDGDGYLGSLTTPYGTTTFAQCLGPSASIDRRALWVRDQGLRDHLFLYVGAEETGLLTNSFSGVAPSTSPFANTLDSAESHLRNSFYWNPVQFAGLSTNFLPQFTNGSQLDLSALQAADYQRARQRHWLGVTNAGDTQTWVGHTLSLERAPSPDGTTPGQITWYDYENKSGGDARFEGPVALPRYTAWRLPDWTSRFLRTERNTLGKPTRTVETWSADGGVTLLRTNVLVYAANSIDLQSVTNASGTRVIYQVFNAQHQVVSNYNALSELTIYTFDASNRLASVLAPSGLLTTNIYGTDGYVAETRAGNRTNRYGWANGLVNWQTDERGLSVTNTYDALNRLRRVVYPDGTSVTNGYDKLDLVWNLDRLGYTNRATFNAFGQVTSRIDAEGRTNSYSYCTCGTLESMQDALGQSTQFSHDLAGRRTLTTYADNSWVSNRFDLLGRVIAVSDSAGASRTNWYNNQGLVVAVSNAFGRLQSSIFDAEDRATNTVDANGVAVASVFDPLGRVLTRSYPDSGVERFGYTLNVAELTATTNQVANIVLYAYDAFGRKTNEIFGGLATGGGFAALSTNSFTYDAGGSLTNLLDGKRQQTRWTYDAYGLLTDKYEDTGSNVFHYTYDAGGHLATRQTPAKGTTAYAYDAVGNLTNVDYPTSHDLTLQYDALNRLTNLVDAVGVTRYGYDALGQLLSEDGPWADDTVNYSYSNRQRTGLSVTQPNAAAWVQSYAWDQMKRLTNVTSPAGAFGYHYSTVSPASLVQSLSLPGGSVITNTYDGLGRLLTTRLVAPDATILNAHSYGYNQAGQRTQQVFTAGSYVDYTYDNMGQLVGAKGKEPGGTTNRWHEQFGYKYDAAGNLNWRTNNDLTQNFQVNSLNELTALYRPGTAMTVAGTTTSAATNVTVNAGAALLYGDYTFARTGVGLVDGTNSFTAIARDNFGRTDTNTAITWLPVSASLKYDGNGNLTSDGWRGFAYDDENQLTEVIVTNASGTVTKSDFAYDGKMRRRLRTEAVLTGSLWATNLMVRYVYDHNLVVQERHFNPQLSSSIPQQLATYTRGRDLSGSFEGAGGIGGMLARTQNGDITLYAHGLYHADGNGNITALVSTNGILLGRYSYDPFGNTLSASGAAAHGNLYRFSSKEYHSASGLYYYLYRWYDPIEQRWMNKDPIVEIGFRSFRQAFAVKNKASMNSYMLLYNAPMDRIDPWGLDSLSTAQTEMCLDECDQHFKKDTASYVQSVSEWRVVGYFIEGISTVVGMRLCASPYFLWGAGLVVGGVGFSIAEYHHNDVVDTKAKRKIWDDWKACCEACKKHGESDMVDEHIAAKHRP